MNLSLLKTESDKTAFICTSVFWGILLCLALIIPVKKATEDKYETISIQLASTSTLKATESKATEQSLVAEQIQEATPVESFATEPPDQVISQENISLPKETPKASTSNSETANKPATQKTVSTQKTETATQKTSHQQVVKSMEELMAENLATQKAKPQVSDVDWDAMFADENTTTVSSQTESISNNLTATSAISGSAASQATLDSSTQVSSSNQGTVSKASSATTSALEKIGSTVFSSTNSAGDVAYNVTADTPSSTGKALAKGTEIKTLEGGSRILIEPSPPVIKISPENEKLIDGSREVNVSFTITPSGQVEPGSIEISPAALLHPKIEAEIKAQIAKWLFQTAESSGQVRFKYNIMKK